VDAAAVAALDAAVERLLSLHHEAGWWKGELQTNVTMDAEDLLLRQFLGIRTEEQTRLSAQWIRSQQREDGTWGSFLGGPPDHAATIEAYAALRLAGEPLDAEHMRLAREYVLDQGGLERSRVFTKIWLSLFGLWSWEHVPAMPPELIYLPPWFPLNLYDFACWARQTVAALTVVWAYRPVREIPITLDELRVGGPPQTRFPVTHPVSRAFVHLDRALHAYERRPVGVLRARALRRMERWILERQEPDGCWGGIQPPWVYSIMALTLRGYPLDHPVIRRAVDGLDGFTVVDEQGRRLEACQSPVWDTCLALIGLSDAGLPADHPALVRAARWLVSEEITRHGDWAVRRPDLAPGGWAFEFENDWYPDIDDTAEVVIARRRMEPGAPEAGAAAARGAAWVLGMQSGNGAWGAFDADNTRGLVRRLPFCDFGEVIDPPSVDVTAHVVEMLAHEGMAGHPAVRRGVDYLLREQEPAAGARTTSTGPAQPCPRSWLPASHRSTSRFAAPSRGSRPCRTRTAGGARTCARTSTARGAGVVPRPPPRPRGLSSPSMPPASTASRPDEGSTGWCARSFPTAGGTSRSSRGRASRATSTSTTTSTGSSGP
jgi:squalene-hopene/tetraprenyl-beta-curcumene cyclase